MSNLTESNKRIWITLGILGALMLLIIFGIYPNNYEQLFTPANTFFDIFIGISLILFIGTLFSKKKIQGERTVGNVKYFALVATLGIAGAFFSYCASPEWIGTYGQDTTVVLLDWFGPLIWATYIPFMLLELLDQEGKLPKWFLNIKRYIYAVTMILAIGISMMAIGGTIPKLFNQMFGWEVNPYAVLILIAALTGLSLFRGINKGMGIFSVVAMLMMAVILIFFITVSVTGQPLKYMLDESVAYFLSIPDLHHNVGSEFQVKIHYTYWAWGYCWSSIIGKFMITLSKGRSLRGASTAVVIIPTIVCWLYIFISRYAFIYTGESYNLLAKFPFFGILYILMVTMMFITSADSTCHSIDQEISKGQKATTNYRKLLWVIVMLVFTTTLLLIGGHTGDALYAIDYLASPILLIVCITGLGIGSYRWIREKKLNKQLN